MRNQRQKKQSIFVRVAAAAAAMLWLLGAALFGAGSAAAESAAAVNSQAETAPAARPAAPAPDDAAAKFWVLSFIESKLSAPNRQISISGIDGALSSNASIGLITIADNQGVWMRLRNIKLDWNRLSLLRGQLSVNSLSADSVEILRKPLPNPQELQVEAKSGFGFTLPSLPIGIDIKELRLRRLFLARELLGQAAAVGLDGKLSLEDNVLNADLQAKRLDAAGGAFSLTAHYDGDKQNLSINSNFDEPQNGILAGLANIEGRPALHFTAAGGGEAGNWAINLHMEAADKPILDGVIRAAPYAAGAGSAAAMGRPGDARVFSIAALGRVAVLLPAEYKPFFGAKTELNISGAVKQEGGLRLDKIFINGDSVYVNGAAETMPGGFLRRLQMRAAIGANAAALAEAAPNAPMPASPLTTLPLKGGAVRLGSLKLNIAYGGEGAQSWSGFAGARNVQVADSRISSLNLSMGGPAENLDDSAARHIGFWLKGAAQNIHSAQAGAFTEDSALNITADGDWRAGKAVALNNLAVNGAGVNLSAQGQIQDYRFTGAAKLIAANISELSGLLGRNFSGSVNLGAQGAVALAGGAFDLNFSGGASGLRAGGNAALNGLLNSDISLSGGVARNENGIMARNLRLANSNFQLYADGALQRGGAQMDFGLNLADIAALMPFAETQNGAAKLPRVSGGISLRGAARGHNGIIAVAAQGGMANGVWNGLPARDLRLSLNGILDNTSHIAQHADFDLRLRGLIGGRALQLAAGGRQDGAALQLDGLNLSYGNARLNAAAHKNKAGLWGGKAQIAADDIGPMAALAFMEGRGSAHINAAFSAAENNGAAEQNIQFDGAADNIYLLPPMAGKGAAPLLSLRHFAANGAAENIFALPRINGVIAADGLRLKNYGIAALTFKSAADGQTSKLNLQVKLDNGAALAASGALSPFMPAEGNADDAAEAALPAAGAPGHWQFALTNLTLQNLPENAAQTMLAADNAPAEGRAGRSKKLRAKAAPKGSVLLGLRSQRAARLVFNGKELRQVDNLSLAIARNGQNAGFAQLNGRLGEVMSLDAQLQNVPLALAGVARPDLGLSGDVSGRAHLGGARAKPDADFNLALQNAAAAATRAAGLAPLNLTAQGQMRNNALSFSANASGAAAAAQKLQLQAQGKIDLTEKQLNLTADAQSLPLNALADLVHNPALAKQKLNGWLSAHAAVSGSFAAPKAQFKLNLQNFSAAALAAAHAAPLNLTAAGAADRRALALDSLVLQGPAGLHFSAAGRVPYSSAGLDLTAKGQLPLALANGALAARGAKLTGLLNIDAALKGAPANPQMQGNFAVSGGEFIDAATNLRLRPIILAGHLSGNQVIVDRLSAQSASGGSVSGGGTLTVNIAAGLPADLRLTLNQFRYNDGVMVAATAGGGLTIRGPMLAGALIAGKINVDKAEIRVPDMMGGASMLEIKNKNARPAIIRTQKRAGYDAGKSKKEAAQAAAAAAKSAPRLDITVSAPNQIFVRGRGLDAEMGGSLVISGPANNIKPSGGFNLIRGRLDLLTQRLIFSSGSVSLAGSFDPSLNFTASTAGDDVTVTVNVSGTPKALKITLSSDPALPQDEILARLIFKRSLNQLSPLQIAQLVDATAELSGLTHSTVMGRLRAAAGLDELDISTDAAGNAEVSAGRYIMDKLYLGVETSSTGEAKGTVNLDITPRLKARGAIGSDSNSNVGVFYERDY